MPRPKLYERTFRTVTPLASALLTKLRHKEWTLAELAQHTKVSAPHLSRLICNSSKGVSIRTVERIAKALGVRVADLV